MRTKSDSPCQACSWPAEDTGASPLICDLCRDRTDAEIEFLLDQSGSSLTLAQVRAAQPLE